MIAIGVYPMGVFLRGSIGLDQWRRMLREQLSRDYWPIQRRFLFYSQAGFRLDIKSVRTIRGLRALR